MHQIVSGLCAAIVLWALALNSAHAQIQRITAPISPAEMKQYAQWLRLSDDKWIIAETFFDEYRDEYVERLRPRIQEFYNMMDDVVRRTHERGANRGALSKELMPSLIRDRDALQAKVTEHEQQFLEQLVFVLDDDQLARMTRVKNGRQRLLRVFTDELSEANIDLVVLVESLNLPTDVYEALERDWLVQFEGEFVEALRLRDAALVDQVRRHWDVYDLRFQAQEPDCSEFEHFLLYQRSVEVLDRAGRARIAASERLVQLNRIALNRLLMMLPHEYAASIYTMYHERSYPQVHPDPGSAHRLFEAALAIEGLGEDQHEALRRIRFDYDRLHSLMSEQMAEAVYYRYWSVYAGRPSRIGNDQELWEVLRQRGEQRESWNRRQIDLIRPILEEQQAAQLPEWDFEANPRRRPWDRDAERHWRQRESKAELERLGQKQGYE